MRRWGEAGLGNRRLQGGGGSRDVLGLRRENLGLIFFGLLIRRFVFSELGRLVLFIILRLVFLGFVLGGLIVDRLVLLRFVFLVLFDFLGNSGWLCEIAVA